MIVMSRLLRLKLRQTLTPLHKYIPPIGTATTLATKSQLVLVAPAM
jgi:hypothetical protein